MSRPRPRFALGIRQNRLFYAPSVSINSIVRDTIAATATGRSRDGRRGRFGISVNFVPVVVGQFSRGRPPKSISNRPR